jgi:Protein of unknown function (DUF3108)
MNLPGILESVQGPILRMTAYVGERDERTAMFAFWYAGGAPENYLAARKKRGHTTGMGFRFVRVTAILALLVCAAGAYYWFRANRASGRPTLASGPIYERKSSVVAEPETAADAASHGNSGAAAGNLPPGNSVTGAVDAKKSAELPVHAGEVLEFSANVAKLNNVANLRLQVNGRRDFLGKSVWHLQAFAHTENPLRMVFALDDQFDSYSDASSMASLQYEMHLNERGQKVDSVQRMTATGRETAPPDVTETRVLAGTRDPLGMLQYLRGVDWAKTPEVHSPVYDGRKLYEVHARQESSSEAVSVAAGNFRASKIAIHVFDNGAEMKDAQFSLYLANNTSRTPVLIEAVIPVATARVELVKASER